jgi:hypothetical protein
MKQNLIKRLAYLEERLLPAVGEPTSFVVRFVAADGTVSDTMEFPLDTHRVAIRPGKRNPWRRTRS